MAYSTDIKDYYRRAWGLKDRPKFKYGGSWADWMANFSDQMTFEEYLRMDLKEKKPHILDRKAEGGRMGYKRGKLIIQPPKVLESGDSKAIRELNPDFMGQLKDKRKVRTSSIDDAFEVRNIIIKNKGHVGNLEELGRLADIVGSGGKVDHRKTQLALDLALDSFEELEGFKLADAKYPKIDAKKFRYLDMVAKSFANYNTAKNASEAAAHLLPANMGKIVDLGGRTDLERGFFNLKGKITPADKKFISERVASLTGKDFNIDSVNELIETTSKVRRAEGSIAAQIKRNAPMNADIKKLYDDKVIQNLIKGDLDNKTRQKILDRAVNIVGDDVAIASRRLFQMAESMAGTRPIEGIIENKNLGKKLIDTQRIIGKNVKDGRAFSSLVYNHYAKTIDNALGTGPGKSFIGYYQQKIKNALDAGMVPDEIFSVTASARRNMHPYAIFTQALDADVNSSIKGANLDGLLSKTHKDLQEIFQGRTYDKLNTADKKAVQELVSTFENAKKDVLKDLKPEIKKTIQLPEFDLKNPPSKSIANYKSYDKNLQSAFDKSYKKVGYSMKVSKEMKTQNEILENLIKDGSKKIDPSIWSKFISSTPVKLLKGVGKAGARTVGAAMPVIGPGMVAWGLSDVNKAHAAGLTNADELAVAYNFGPEIAKMWSDYKKTDLKKNIEEMTLKGTIVEGDARGYENLSGVDQYILNRK